MKPSQDLLKQMILGGQSAGSLASQSAPTSLALTDWQRALQQGTFASPSQALLSAAAMQLSEQKLRQPCLSSIPIPEPLAAESLVVCGDGVGHWLQRLLHEGDEALLLELLGLMGAHHQRVTAAQLPALLRLATDKQTLRPHLIAVLGQRGLWLARQQSDWRAWVEPSAESPSETLADCADPTDQVDRWAMQWQDFTGQWRQRVFRQQRQRNPELARAGLMSVWSQEAAKQRQQLMHSFAVGLTVADADFLRLCQKDRSQPVRWLAASYLIELADPAQIQALKTALSAILTVADGTTLLQVQLPEHYQPDWKSWGLQEKPVLLADDSKVGQKASWLYQLVCLVKPSLLSAWLSLSLPQMIEACLGSEFSQVLLQGLDQSAAQFNDHEYLTLRQKLLQPRPQIRWLTLVAKKLPLSTLEALLLPLLSNYHQQPLKECWQLVDLLPKTGGFSAEFSLVLAKFLAVQVHQYQQGGGYFDSHYHYLGYQLSICAFDQIYALLNVAEKGQGDNDRDFINNNFYQLLYIYQQRQQFHQEFVS